MRSTGLFTLAWVSLLFAGNAVAADAIVAGEPEPMDYLRRCDAAYGLGYFFIPGTETCLNVHGYLRVDFEGGDPNGQDTHPGGGGDSWFSRSRLNLRVSTGSDTEYGALKTYAEIEFNRDDNTDAYVTPKALTVEMSGFLVGYADTLYTEFTDDAGTTINEYYEIDYGDFERTQIRYTYLSDAGFSVAVGVEDDSNQSNDRVYDFDVADDNYIPDLVAGAGYLGEKFKARLVAGYDESMEEGAIKLRLDGEFGPLSLFVMGGWNTDGDRINNYALWDGDWAAWVGAIYKATDKATINASMNVDQGGDFEAALNLAYAVVPGFSIIPEIDYREDEVDDAANGWGWALRFQRNF